VKPFLFCHKKYIYFCYNSIVFVVYYDKIRVNDLIKTNISVGTNINNSIIIYCRRMLFVSDSTYCLIRRDLVVVSHGYILHCVVVTILPPSLHRHDYLHILFDNTKNIKGQPEVWIQLFIVLRITKKTAVHCAQMY